MSPELKDAAMRLKEWAYNDCMVVGDGRVPGGVPADLKTVLDALTRGVQMTTGVVTCSGCSQQVRLVRTPAGVLILEEHISGPDARAGWCPGGGVRFSDEHTATRPVRAATCVKCGNSVAVRTVTLTGGKILDQHCTGAFPSPVCEGSGDPLLPVGDEPDAPAPTGTCTGCGHSVRLDDAGLVDKHTVVLVRGDGFEHDCPGAGKLPVGAEQPPEPIEPDDGKPHEVLALDLLEVDSSRNSTTLPRAQVHATLAVLDEIRGLRQQLAEQAEERIDRRGDEDGVPPEPFPPAGRSRGCFS